jgi:hypothetical protein
MEDTIVHHASNYRNCPHCMDLWIKRENEITAKAKKQGLKLDPCKECGSRMVHIHQ